MTNIIYIAGEYYLPTKQREIQTITDVNGRVLQILNYFIQRSRLSYCLHYYYFKEIINQSLYVFKKGTCNTIAFIYEICPRYWFLWTLVYVHTYVCTVHIYILSVNAGYDFRVRLLESSFNNIKLQFTTIIIISYCTHYLWIHICSARIHLNTLQYSEFKEKDVINWSITI